MKPLLGGKGANLAEMTGSGYPRAARLHRHHRGLRLLLRQRRSIPTGSSEEIEEHLQRAREAHRQDPRRPEQPAAGLRPLRRGVLHAGHDGHRPQPGPERRDRRGAGPGHRQPALRLRLLPPLHPHVRRRGHGGGPAGCSRTRSRPRRPRWAPRSTPTSPPTTCATSPCASRRSCGENAGEQFPADPAEAAPPGHRGRVQELGQPSRQGLPPHPGHPRRSGHRRQRADHGVRQQGRDLRHRRGLHPRPLHRRELLLRRVPHERPGRGRGGRRARTRGRCRRCARSCPRRSSSSTTSARPSRSTTATCRTSSSPSRTASSTCCRPATASAPRRPPCKMAVDMVAEGLITKDEAAHARRPGPARPAAAPAPRSQGRSYNVLATGLGASPGRGRGPGGLRRRRRPRSGAPRASRSSWCAGRPTPTTSTASCSRRASSPATAA